MAFSEGLMRRSRTIRLLHETVRFAFGLIALASLTGLCFWLDFRLVSTAFTYLILIVLLSLAGGFISLIALSFIAVGCLNYLFAPPIFDFRIDYPEDIITVAAFLITSLIITGLVSRMRAGRDELAHVLHGLPALVWNTSPDGSADFCNQRFRDYTGFSSEELYGLGWMKALHPEDRDVGEWRAALAAGKPIEKEARVRRADREYRRFMLSMTPLRNEQGTILKWYGAASDIEDRKRVEQSLRRSESYLADAQRISRTGSFAYDVARGRMVHSSEEHHRLFGFHPAEAMPAPGDWTQRIHPDDRKKAVDAMLQTLRERTDYEVDFRTIHPDGTIKYIHSVSHAVLSPSSDLVEIRGTSTDVTERQQAEEARVDAQNKLAHANRVATMGQLTASIAHEVNQPVGAVVTNAYAALRFLRTESPDLDRASQALDDIIKDSQRVSDVVARIRSLIKRSPPQTDLLDINELIVETIALIRSEILRSAISLETELVSHLPAVRGDRVQLQQVIMNLLMNAIEAMSNAEGGTRELRIGTSEDSKDRILITVRDSGPMLKSESLERFFEAFYSTKPNGMGIGLSICRSIVEAHGGRIWATDNAPHGVTLQIVLPALTGTAS
jgi:PAS domain S-box-containing protein